MQYKTINCGLCNFAFVRGVYVCQGCQGDVWYGATKAERSEVAKYSMVLCGGTAAAIIYGIPALLNSKLGTTIPTGFGLGSAGVVATIIVAFVGAALADRAYARNKASLVRTVRRRIVR
jgi:hypothetical protein